MSEPRTRLDSIESAIAAIKDGRLAQILPETKSAAARRKLALGHLRKSLERATEEAEEVMYQALARGLSFKLNMGNIITLTPALTVTEEEVTEAVGILDECLGLVG